MIHQIVLGQMAVWAPILAIIVLVALIAYHNAVKDA